MSREIKRKKQGNLLTRFTKKECANCSSDGLCYDYYDCKILDNKPCGYFEKSVLGPHDYKYRLLNYNYEKLFNLYSNINKAFKQFQVNIHSCLDCDTPISKGKRYCEKCLKKHNKQSYRRRLVNS